MGPIIMARPKAAPIAPIAVARSEFGVTSVTTACAVAMLAAKKPERMRAA